MNRLGQPGREKGGEVRDAAQRERAHDFDETTLLDGPALPAPRAVGRVKPALFHLDHDEVELQEGIIEQRGNAHELGEDVARGTMSG